MLAGIDTQPVGRAEENHLVAHFNPGDSSDIGQGQVHRNTSHDGGVMLADDDTAAIGETAIQAVGVAYGENGDTGRALGDVGASVSQGVIRTDIAYGKDSRLPGQNGFDSQTPLATADLPSRTLKWKIVAVQREAGPHHIVPGLAAGNGGRGVGHVIQRGPETSVSHDAPSFLEALPLIFG